jgi:microcystin-dependent protein
MPMHDHAVNTRSSAAGFSGSSIGGEVTGGTPDTVNANATGSGGAHPNVQPTIPLNYIIKV